MRNTSSTGTTLLRGVEEPMFYDKMNHLNDQIKNNIETDVDAVSIYPSLFHPSDPKLKSASIITLW